jgi:N-acetylglucosaminyl-diphospho-decaprenol L-rhamnosyltransferase
MNLPAAKPVLGLPSIEVIVVAFNSAESLATCLAALPAAGEGLELRVTVIDNCSAEDIGSTVRNSGICAEVVRSQVNLGFGGGNNIGIRRALQKRPLPDAILVLNPDVELPPATISKLYFILEETRCGAVSPQIRDRSGMKQENPLRTLWGRRIRPGDLKGRPSTSVDRLPGSCMLICTEALVRVGLFDERYFLYWEEIDLCVRLRRAKYELLIAEDVVAAHGGAGESSLRRHRTYYMWRNQIYFSFKNYGLLLGFIFVAERLFVANAREVFRYVRRGRSDLILAGLAGLWAGLRGEVGPSASRFALPRNPLPGESTPDQGREKDGAVAAHI